MGEHKDVSTEYTRWAGDCSLGFSGQGQLQHGVHLSMLKALRTGFSGTPRPRELKARMTSCGQIATRVRGQGSQRPEPQACKIIKCFLFQLYDTSVCLRFY